MSTWSVLLPQHWRERGNWSQHWFRCFVPSSEWVASGLVVSGNIGPSDPVKPLAGQFLGMPKPKAASVLFSAPSLNKLATGAAGSRELIAHYCFLAVERKYWSPKP
mmetsp:Transcript_43029/g.96925  ORF Transcript_43029/g.96925 Transcript_43029/m.96925 type:complete len:106 (-) Transcript_43029:1177-1494(-)